MLLAVRGKWFEDNNFESACLQINQNISRKAILRKMH
jgi:hypothetical protein